jgi:hypothetical protein
VKSQALVLLLSLTTSPVSAATKAPKTHTVSLGAVRRVPTPSLTPPEEKCDETSTIKVRPLFLDDCQKEWTNGEAHDITDRTFAIRRALHINDALPTDFTPHWIWQPGPWITVDRVAGHITALHLPDFDPVVSNAIWFRTDTAYDETATSAKAARLYVIVAQLGARRPSCRNSSANGPSRITSFPVCQPANGSDFLSASPSNPPAARRPPTTSSELPRSSKRATTTTATDQRSTRQVTGSRNSQRKPANFTLVETYLESSRVFF